MLGHIMPAAQASHPLSPDSVTVAKLVPDLLTILRNGDQTDPNAVPLSSAGINNALGTPEVIAARIPAGYTLLPLEFMLDRGDVAALNAGDRVICVLDDGIGNETRVIADATILTVSRPYRHPSIQSSSQNRATHRVFTLLVTQDGYERFGDTYDIDRGRSGSQIGVLRRHPDSIHH